MTDSASADRVSTGIDGLDRILHGGLVPRRGYMIRGEPGAGKTTLGLHFLTEGIENGESTLYVNLEEDEDDITRNAESLGFDLSEVEFLDLSPTAEVFSEDQSYDVFEADEVEDDSVTAEIRDRVVNVDPDRVLVDPVTQLRYLIGDDQEFRKQVTGFMQLLKEQDATVLFTSQISSMTPDDDLQFISHGVINLQHTSSGRTIEVAKIRGSDMDGGRHAVRMTDEGLVVYPKLKPSAHRREFDPDQLPSGVPGIDQVLNGGLERGTITIISGPTGVGKTTLGAQFMKEAAGRGERSVIFEFEESLATFTGRCNAINIPVTEMFDRGTLQFEEIEAMSMSSDEFANMVREEVEDRDARIVMIDGTAGYRLSLRGDNDELVKELHTLCRYLKNMGVTVILVEEVTNITGEFKATERNLSYIADNIVFLRYLEVHGELRKAIGVLKKRMSGFERTLRAFDITEHGITVGDPLTNLRGILQGSPEFVDDAGDKPME
ncbi:ATPase domain-containing protein [Halococcoides cellulosivorans]|uniref:non-specific serine/threonine protein kinase n=1 Tax=Halococcoides cellulosivorans TaxID=1679096 RepID=A0A2R4WZF9_9EURY|nr:ATPase domain-containing protein [Halococcoides cellulosivorans]AWB26920.1 recombinase RecA [Halococcoides cellulosivorans]